MTKEDNEDFENPTKCWICDSSYFDDDVKVRAHCHITGKYTGSVYIDCNINIRLNHKIPVVFHNPKLWLLPYYAIARQIQSSNKRHSKWIRKIMSFNINNKWSFIDSCQLFSSSLDSLFKNLTKDDFKYLTQEFECNILDLVKQKGLCPYEYMSDLKSLKINC